MKEIDFEKVFGDGVSSITPGYASKCMIQEYDRQLREILAEELAELEEMVVNAFLGSYSLCLEVNKPTPAPTPATCDCNDRKVLERAGFLWKYQRGWIKVKNGEEFDFGSHSADITHCPCCNLPLP